MSRSHNKEIKAYVEKMFNHNYSERFCPSWVDFDSFKEYKCQKLFDILIENSEFINEFYAKFSFVIELLLAFNGDIDPGSGELNNFFENYADNFEFPKRIKEILINRQKIIMIGSKYKKMPPDLIGSIYGYL